MKKIIGLSFLISSTVLVGACSNETPKVKDTTVVVEKTTKYDDSKLYDKYLVDGVELIIRFVQAGGYDTSDVKRDNDYIPQKSVLSIATTSKNKTDKIVKIPAEKFKLSTDNKTMNFDFKSVGEATPVTSTIKPKDTVNTSIHTELPTTMVNDKTLTLEIKTDNKGTVKIPINKEQTYNQLAKYMTETLEFDFEDSAFTYADKYVYSKNEETTLEKQNNLKSK